MVVKDNGKGIPKNELDFIFEPYFTTKHENQEREGTGIGLTIVRHDFPKRVGNHEFLRKFGKIVTDDIARIERLTQEILDYSDQRSLHLQLENLNEILEACVNASKLNVNGKAIQITE